jgi:hypothetical protein
MDPISGGNPPDTYKPSASFAAAVTKAIAQFTGKSENRDDPTQPPVVAVAEPSTAAENEANAFAMHNEGSSRGTDVKGEDRAESNTSSTEDSVKNNAAKHEEVTSFAMETEDHKELTEMQDVDMAEKQEDESMGAQEAVVSVPSSASKQLQAVLREQIVNVKVMVDNEVILDDGVDGNGMIFAKLPN